MKVMIAPITCKTILDQNTKWQNLPLPVKKFKTPLTKRIINFTFYMKSSVDTFLLYFDGKMIQTIVDHTNIESVREKGNKWKDIDTME